jgi:hypothetical protein
MRRHRLAENQALFPWVWSDPKTIGPTKALTTKPRPRRRPCAGAFADVANR